MPCSNDNSAEHTPCAPARPVLDHVGEILQWWSANTGISTCTLYLFKQDSGLLEQVLSLGMPKNRISIQDELEECELQSAWTVPLMVHNRLIGVIQVFCRKIGSLSAEEYSNAYSSAQVAAANMDKLLETQRHPALQALEKLKEGIPRDKLKHQVRQEVLDSWERCQQWFDLDKASDTEVTLSPPYCTPKRLFEIQETNASLLKAARQHLGNLFNRDNLEYAVLLADPEGWIIDLFGNSQSLRQLQQVGIWFGTNISEEYMGNTAIGSALATQKSIYFHSYEHYFVQLQHWSTAAAPILVENGTRLLGVCAFVTQSSELNPYVFPLVQSASIAIGNAVQVDELQQDAIRVHQSLLSNLDYHVVQLDIAHKVVSQRHPIPVFEDVQREMIRITQQGEYSHFEMSILGRAYVVDVRDLWDAKGVFKGRLGLFRDVTQSKQIESRLQDTERLSVLASLAAGIAHEIRNPLTTARGFLQLFEERLNAEQDKRFLNLTINELDRIHQLVMDFMSLARPDEPHYGETDLTSLIQNTVQFLNPEATLHGVTLSTDVPQSPVLIWADEKQVKQILMNIVQNALHACNSNDSVTVRLIPEDDKVEVVVSDTGCGMSPEQLDRIFQPFFTTKPTGTGLGLSITKRIVEEHNGSITVESTEGAGTTIRIVLNRASSETSSETSPKLLL